VSKVDAMQDSWHAATKNMSKANFGGELPLSYIEATFFLHFEGTSTMQNRSALPTPLSMEPFT
jgi:hypothetical protein